MRKLIILTTIFFLTGAFSYSFSQQEKTNQEDSVEIKYNSSSWGMPGLVYEHKISRSNKSSDEDDYFRKIENIIKTNFSGSEITYVDPDAAYIDIFITLDEKQYHYSSMHPFFQYDEEIKAALEFDRKFIAGFDTILKISLDLLNRKLSPNKANPYPRRFRLG